MRQRALAAVVVLTLVMSLAPRFAVGQTASGSRWTMPRLPDGSPDLQGVWLSDSATPLERPPALAGRARLTDEEVAVLQARADRIFKNGRSAYAAGDAAFSAAFNDVETHGSVGSSTSSSLGMVDRVFDNDTSLVVDPADGRIPRVTPAARRRQDAVASGWQYKTGPEDFSNIHRCITTGVPRLGGNFGAGPYSYHQIIQTSDCVAFIMEAFHDVRGIPLDGRPQLPERIRQWNGDSRGGVGGATRWWSRPGTSGPTAISRVAQRVCTWSSGSPAPATIPLPTA